MKIFRECYSVHEPVVLHSHSNNNNLFGTAVAFILRIVFSLPRFSLHFKTKWNRPIEVVSLQTADPSVLSPVSVSVHLAGIRMRARCYFACSLYSFRPPLWYGPSLAACQSHIHPATTGRTSTLNRPINMWWTPYNKKSYFENVNLQLKMAHALHLCVIQNKLQVIWQKHSMRDFNFPWAKPLSTFA